MLGEYENQFSLTREALSTCGAQKQIPIRPSPWMRRLAWIIYALGALALFIAPVQLAPLNADSSFVPRLVWPILQLSAATCLAITLIYGPGLLWLQRRNCAADLALATFAGPLALAVLGLAVGHWAA